MGAPNAGSLLDGVQVPEGPHYIRRNPQIMWGSSYAVTSLTGALANFRAGSRYTGPIVVADLSAPEGGELGPHASHQSGRDADVWLPQRLQADGSARSANREAPPVDDVDWDASWELVEALVATGAVEEIFMSARAQERMHAAALRAGAAREHLDLLLQWPRDPTSSAGLIRYSEEKRGELHVRFRCATWEPTCTHRLIDGHADGHADGTRRG